MSNVKGGDALDMSDDDAILEIKSPQDFVGGPHCVICRNIEERWAIVALDWETHPRLGIRWFHGTSGNPQSRGHPTWFVVPQKLNQAILAALPIDAEVMQEVNQHFAKYADVRDILNMWRELERAYQQCNDDEQERIRAANGNREIAFMGFDKNSSNGHYFIARKIINNADDYLEYRGKELNSHDSLTTKMHTRMLPIYRAACETYDTVRDGALMADDVIAILRGHFSSNLDLS